MTIDPADDIRDTLVLAGVGGNGGVADWAIHVSKMLNTPDRTIVVINTGGVAPNPHWLVDFPTVQIRIRGKKSDYVAARGKAQAVKDALLGITPRSINGTWYDGFFMIGDIIQIGYDESDRILFSTNWRFIVEPPVSGTTARLPL
jgi:hypothetical protein